MMPRFLINRNCHLLTLVVILSFVCQPAFAELFGPGNTYECIQKYQQKTYYMPGVRVVRKACLVVFEGDRRFKKTGECILDNAARLSSHPASLDLINKCTTKFETPQMYKFFVNALEDE